jgi:predicted nicotinamide N-methyase
LITFPVSHIHAKASTNEMYLRIASRYDVVEKKIEIAHRTIHLLKVRDTNRLVDALNPETFAEDERLPYWADLWTSSLELARFCLLEANLKSKRVLELGCGLGLSGIAAALAGARVTFSDYEKDALEFCRYNAAKNLPSNLLITNVSFLHLDWRKLPALEKFDMILGADVIYERRNFFPLVTVLETLLDDDGMAVFTEPGRSIGGQFFSLIREHGFHLNLTTHAVEYEGKQSEVVRAAIERHDTPRRP